MEEKTRAAAMDESQLRFPQAQAPSMVNRFVPCSERLLHELTGQCGNMSALRWLGDRDCLWHWLSTARGTGQTGTESVREGKRVDNHRSSRVKGETVYDRHDCHVDRACGGVRGHGH